MSTKKKILTWEELCALEPGSVVRCRTRDYYDMLILRQTKSGPVVAETDYRGVSWIKTRASFDDPLLGVFYATNRRGAVILTSSVANLLFANDRIYFPGGYPISPKQTLALFKSLGAALGYEVEE